MRTKEELLLECIEQFIHMEDIYGFNSLTTTKSLMMEIEKVLSEQDGISTISRRCSLIWQPTCSMRWVIETLPFLKDADVTIRTLQQLWEDELGNQEWRDVESIN